jgi:Fur family zinc uptake transcriptional regulator
MSVKTKKTERARRLDLAENLCAMRSARLTGLRRRALEILLKADSPLKAYDMIELMRLEGRRVTPATIYRVLEFLQGNGLAHRINAVNAFTPCAHLGAEHRRLVTLVCSRCGQAREIDDQSLNDAMDSRLGELGFSVQSVEIMGACEACAESAARN